jgi:hypothetical protein
MKSEIMKFEEIVIVRVTTAYTYCTITTVLFTGINTWNHLGMMSINCLPKHMCEVKYIRNFIMALFIPV